MENRKGTKGAPAVEREAFNEWYVDAIWGNEDFNQSVWRYGYCAAYGDFVSPIRPGHGAG